MKLYLAICNNDNMQNPSASFGKLQDKSLRSRGFTPIFVLISLVAIAVAVGGGFYLNSLLKEQKITDFESCARAGYPVMESYPRQCKTPSGKSFTEKVSEQDQKKVQPPVNGGFCIQVITPAKDPKTGQCKEFPTPCDVPEGWETLDSCSPTSNDISSWKIYTNNEYGFTLKYPNNWLEGQPRKNYYIPDQGVRTFGISLGPSITITDAEEKTKTTASSIFAVDITIADQEVLNNLTSCFVEQVNLKSEIIISGKPASLYKNESLCGQGNNRDIVQILDDGRLIQITVNRTSTTTDQMISSFKLLK